MPTKLTSQEVLLNSNVRGYIQQGGSRPSKPLAYSGIDAQYMRITGVDDPESGDITPIYVHDLRRAGRYRQIARTTSPADLPTATMSFYEKLRGIARHLIRMGCLTAYEVVGNCADLSSFVTGATAYVMIYSEGKVTGKSLGDRSTAGDADNPLSSDVSVTFSAIYPAGTIGFGEVAAVEVTREVVDSVYAQKGGCQECDTPDVYTQWIYAITKSSGAASPGMPSEVVYTTNGGSTWTDTGITGIGATEDPIAIDIVGQYLIVVTKTAGGATLGGYYYTTINQATGVPGTWTKVTNGFVANKAPNDIYVDGTSVYFCADGGYIYKTTDITTGVSVLNAGSATTNNLLRIHGLDDQIVSVGQSSTIIRTINRGVTWATTTTTVSGIPLDITALFVLDRDYYWVGTSNSGRLFYTETGGELWTQKMFAGSGSGNIRDVYCATSECIYVLYDNGTTATLYASVNAGVDFVSSADNAQKRIVNWPTFTRANRIHAPIGPDAGTSANYVTVVGLSGGGTDGIILIGAASIS